MADPLDFPSQVTATDPDMLLGSNATVPAKTPINEYGRAVLQGLSGIADTTPTLLLGDNGGAASKTTVNALGRGLLNSTPAAARAALKEDDYTLGGTYIEEFNGITPFADGMVSSTTGGASAASIATVSGNFTGILEIRSGTTVGASVLGRVAASSAANGGVRLTTVSHFLGFRVAASSVPGTLTTDDSRHMVGLSNSGSSEGSQVVDFYSLNGGNYRARILSGTTGEFDTGLPSLITIASATTTNASATVTTVNTTGLQVGQPVAGAGIPDGTLIIAVSAGDSFTMSANATASATITAYAGIWYNFGIYYNAAVGRVAYYNGTTLLGEIGPGSTTPGTNTTQAIPTGSGAVGSMFVRMAAMRVANTTSNFKMMLDTYIHRVIRPAPIWPEL